MSTSADIETLLQHADWVRGLASSLVLDQDEVDEVVQQTWLVAVERTPPRLTSPRGWLRQVVRRLAVQVVRRESRRLAAERGLTIEERDLVTVDRLELHRHLVEAVDALPEPYRGLVLLRYFEGLDPKEISQRLEEPRSIVRNRLSRALEMLRARLDRDRGPRRMWSLALLPLCLPRSAVAASEVGGGAARGLSGFAKLGAAAAGVLLIAAFVASRSDRAAENGRAVESGRPSSASAAARPLRAVAPAHGLERGRTDTEPPPGHGVRPRTPPPATVRGRVLDGDGRPVPGALVRVVCGRPAWTDLDDFERQERRFQATAADTRTSTGDDGRFELAAPRERRAWLLVTAPGHAACARLLESGTAEIDLTLDGARTLTCIVKDEEGHPLDGVDVAVETEIGDPATVPVLVETRTAGADGVFTFDLQRHHRIGIRELLFDRLFPGPVSTQQKISLRRRSFVTTRIAFFGNKRLDDQGRLEFRMLRARRVTLQVVTPAGETLRGRVRLLVRMQSGGYERVVETGDDGRAVLDDVPPGDRAHVVVDSADWVSGGTLLERSIEPSTSGTVISVAPAGDAYAEVPLRRGAVVRGRLLDQATGRPLAGITVRACPRGTRLGSRLHVARARTDRDGRFLLRSVVPGRVGLLLESPHWALLPDDAGRGREDDGRRRGHTRTRPPGGSEREEVFHAVATAKVSGIVVDDGGRPVPEARVALRVEPRDLIGWPAPVHRLLRGPAIVADGAGTFSLPAVAPGLDVELAARAPGFAAAFSDPFAVDAGERLDGVRIVVRRRPPVRIAVRGPDGVPVRGLAVAIRAGRTHRAFHVAEDFTGRTDHEGAVITTSLPPGPARVVLADVRPLGLALPPAFSGAIDVPEDEPLRLDIELRRPLLTRVQVVDGSGEPATGLDVLALPARLGARDLVRVRRFLEPAGITYAAENVADTARILSASRGQLDEGGGVTLTFDEDRDYRMLLYRRGTRPLVGREVLGRAVFRPSETPIRFTVGPLRPLAESDLAWTGLGLADESDF